MLHFGEEHIPEAIRALEQTDDRRPLVGLLIMKSYLLVGYADIDTVSACFNEALELAYAEYGKYHLLCARAHDMLAEALMTRSYVLVNGSPEHIKLYEEWRHHRLANVDILDNLLGSYHRQTVQAIKSAINGFIKHGHQDEADELLRKYPGLPKDSVRTRRFSALDS
jgi:hypothetical protein